MWAALTPVINLAGSILGRGLQPRQVVYQEETITLPPKPAPTWPWLVAGSVVLAAAVLEVSRG